MLRGNDFTNTSTVSLLGLLLFVMTFSPDFCHGRSNHLSCIQTERDALLEFKRGLTDPSNLLASWVTDGDCCRGWAGVICDNTTGHVLELHLAAVSLDDYANSVDIYSATYSDRRAYVNPAAFGGQVSSSLLNLKHLRFLDLSNNDFRGIPIPTFLGSMGNLRNLKLSQAGFGGKIPHQLGNLSNLIHLNVANDELNFKELYVDSLDWISGLLSLEYLSLSFLNLSNVPNWFPAINKLPALLELHLSDCQLRYIPEVRNVNSSFLSVLDLSGNGFGNQKSSVLGWVFRLRSLVSLNLAGNEFSGPFPSDLQNLTSLVELDLSGNDFQGPIPGGLANMTSLRKLDLSQNHFNSSMPDWSHGFSRLELLYLDDNDLQGEISSSIGNIPSLSGLGLSYNQLEGVVPTLFRHLCNLKSLDLSGNKLKQEVNEVFEILSGCVSDELQALLLDDCNLSGQVTDNLCHLKNLYALGLRQNQISGPLPFCLGELTSLELLYLSDNRLTGTLPHSVGGLSKLVYVDVSDNSLVGDVSEVHFKGLAKLRAFVASGNHLILRVSPNWIPGSLQLEELELGSWNVGPQVPLWLGSLKQLSYLGLSNTGISSIEPLLNLSSQLRRLDLSHNQIHGVIPDIFKLAALNAVIDLSSNRIMDPLPHISSNISDLDLSNNSISGSISNFICHELQELNNLQALNLEGNLLSGEIPDCWRNWPYLAAINLNNNKFTGQIPKSIGALSLLESLHLRNNRLEGEMPVAMRNCTRLQTLDMGGNKLGGNIPGWTGESLPGLVILNLRENQFHGSLPKELCGLTSLQILDLADNNLTGCIPRCIGNITVLTTAVDSRGHLFVRENVSMPSFEENMQLLMKGQTMDYSTILGLVSTLDLSNNNLSGEIPEEITTLGGLQSLNLSENFLVGSIPEDIGAMRSLESLDFSLNQLSGRIPQSMSNLTFLNHLNLSRNSLSGKIPSGPQMQTFGANSFLGNELCGPPLSNNCSEDNGGATSATDDGSGIKIDWFYVSMAFGFVVGFWSIVGPLMFSRQWRHAYYHYLNRLWSRIRF